MGVASLVLGIIALVLDVFTAGAAGWLGMVFGIIGTILGAIARNKALPEKKGIATAGLVCSIIGIILGLLLYIACVGCIGCMGAASDL